MPTSQHQEREDTRWRLRHEEVEALARETWRLMGIRKVNIPPPGGKNGQAELLQCFIDAQSVLESGRAAPDYVVSRGTASTAFVRPLAMVEEILLINGAFIPPEEQASNDEAPALDVAPMGEVVTHAGDPSIATVHEFPGQAQDAPPVAETSRGIEVPAAVELHGQMVHVLKVEVGLHADVEKRLKALEELAMEWIKEKDLLQRQLITAQAQITDLGLRNYSGETRKEVSRIAYVGPHKAHFIKLREMCEAGGLKVDLRWYDSTKSPNDRIRADFAVCNVDVPHSWSDKVRREINGGNFAFIPSGNDQMFNMVKLWAS